MSKVVMVKFMPATSRLDKRVQAQSDSACVVTEWDYDLTDSANYRKAVNHLLCQVNSEPHNAIHRIRWQVVADAPALKGAEHVYIIAEA